MNVNSMARLFSEVLASQVETGKHGSFAPARLREALTTGPSLSEAERSLLLLSPVARSDFQRMRCQVKEEIQQRLDQLGVERQLYALAADSDEGTVSLKGNGFQVTLYQRSDLGIPWVILVQLGPVYLQAINPMTVLRLVDSGGLEWCRGKPDGQGEITASWDDRETDILARSKRFSLSLEPV